MPRYIDNSVVRNVDGREMQSAKRDEEGDPVYLDVEGNETDKAFRTNAQGDRFPHEFALEPGTVREYVRIAVLNIPRNVQKGDDSLRVHQIINQLMIQNEEAVNGSNPPIQLKEKTYTWLHKLLQRPVPLSKEEKDRDAPQRVYASELWSLNHAVIVNQMRDSFEQKNLLEDDEDDEA